MKFEYYGDDSAVNPPRPPPNHFRPVVTAIVTSISNGDLPSLFRMLSPLGTWKRAILVSWWELLILESNSLILI